MSLSELADLAASLQRACESGRVCTLVGRGVHDRIEAIAGLLAAGRIDRDRALRLAREAEAVVFCFSPLPPGDPT